MRGSLLVTCRMTLRRSIPIISEEYGELRRSPRSRTKRSPIRWSRGCWRCRSRTTGRAREPGQRPSTGSASWQALRSKCCDMPILDYLTPVITSCHYRRRAVVAEGVPSTDAGWRDDSYTTPLPRRRAEVTRPPPRCAGDAVRRVAVGASAAAGENRTISTDDARWSDAWKQYIGACRAAAPRPPLNSRPDAGAVRMDRNSFRQGLNNSIAKKKKVPTTNAKSIQAVHRRGRLPRVQVVDGIRLESPGRGMALRQWLEAIWQAVDRAALLWTDAT